MTDIIDRLENWNTVHEEDADCDGSLYLAARDEILRLREGWRVIECAPRDGTWFLMSREDDVPLVVNWPMPCAIGIWHKINGRWAGCAHGRNGTHWRPLPDPPPK